jgi:hypothetical protein
MKKAGWILLFALISLAAVRAQQEQTSGDAPAGAAKAAEAAAADTSPVIPSGAKIFVAPMPDSFDDYMKKAIEAKKVPVSVVESRDQADFELTGTSESHKAGAAKKVLMGSWHSKESASVKVENLKSGVIAFAYSYNTTDSQHGKKSSAESCAKHLKQKIESGK